MHVYTVTCRKVTKRGQGAGWLARDSSQGGGGERGIWRGFKAAGVVQGCRWGFKVGWLVRGVRRRGSKEGWASAGRGKLRRVMTPWINMWGTEICIRTKTTAPALRRRRRGRRGVRGEWVRDGRGGVGRVGRGTFSPRRKGGEKLKTRQAQK